MKKNNVKEFNMSALERRRRTVETCSTFGLILVAVGMLVPFTAIDNSELILAMKLVYATGALLFTVARMVNVNAPSDSLKLRRMRRMEMWAGFCFILGGFFWFYNSARYSAIPFSVAIMRDTVAFTMAGAIIQVVASWMITSRMRKELTKKPKDSDNKNDIR